MLILNNINLIVTQNNVWNTLLIEFFELCNIISGKYLIIAFLMTLYISYHSTSDKIIYSSYTSDNYKDVILSLITSKILKQAKFSIHLINNKILHPITIFMQNF